MHGKRNWHDSYYYDIATVKITNSCWLISRLSFPPLSHSFSLISPVTSQEREGERELSEGEL